jgi:hypothetical protein
MTMQTANASNDQMPRRAPWNKGKLLGTKPPLRTKRVWSIRTTLQVDGRLRDLAMFNLAIDSKLRGCDVVNLKVEDVALHGLAIDRATVSRPERRLTITSRHPARSPTISYSPVVAIRNAA